MSRLESTQHAADLAVSGAWRGTKTHELFEELGWETLAHADQYLNSFDQCCIKSWNNLDLTDHTESSHYSSIQKALLQLIGPKKRHLDLLGMNDRLG